MFEGMRSDLKKIRSKALDTAKTGWYAGLGALSQAESTGKETFESLVKHGKSKRRSKTMVEKAAVTLDTKKDVAVNRVESGVKEASEYVMKKAGIPTREQLTTLIDRVDELTAKLEEKSS